MEYIVALSEERNFVRAAERCHVSQPALSMQVKKAEELLGVSLFDRSKNPLEVTPHARQFVARLREFLTEMQRFQRSFMEDLSSLAGEFRFGIIPTLSAPILPDFLKSFAEQHAEAHLTIYELQTEDIIGKLKNDALDLALLATPLEEDTIREVPVFHEPFYVYASEGHPLYQKPSVSTEDFHYNDLLLLADGHCVRNQVLNICMRDNKKATGLNYHYESGSLETLIRLVDKGIGFTLLPELSLPGTLENPKIKSFAEFPPSREISLVMHRSFPRERLIEAIRKILQQIVPERMLSGKPCKTIGIK